MIADELPIVDTFNRKLIWNEWERLYLTLGEDTLSNVKEISPGHLSIFLEYRILHLLSNRLDSMLLENPDETLTEGEKVLIDFRPYEMDGTIPHLRIINLPNDCRIPIGEISSMHMGKLICIEGIVKKATFTYANITEAAFICSRCGRIIYEKQECNGRLSYPMECHKTQDGCGRSAQSTKFKLSIGDCKYRDLRKVEIQELPDAAQSRAQPASITAYIWDDLAKTVEVGDRVLLNGIVKCLQNQSSTQCEMYLDTNSIETQQNMYEEIEISEEDEHKIQSMSKSPDLYHNLVASIAPSIHGYEMEKLALAMQLFSGVPKKLDDGITLRGDIHVLLVGDPGMAKSQLLRHIARLAPRGIYTSGKSSTAAGLCATAVMDETSGRWFLEAGALVLADKGHACIDELDKMSSNDRSAMHEAMESQTVSIAKAGITVQLRTRCPITGAANPKFGSFTKDLPITDQINMPLTLMSRFDIILIMRDIVDKNKDMAISEHIISMHKRGEAKSTPNEDIAKRALMETNALMPVYSQELLRKYIAYAHIVCPVLSPEAEKILKDEYLRVRAQKGDMPITPRHLEAYIRLAEAFARARLSETVTKNDAELAVMLMDICMRRATISESFFERIIFEKLCGLMKSHKHQND